MPDQDHDRLSTAAIVTYASLALLTLVVTGVFSIIWLRISVTDVMVGVLGGVISTVGAIATGAVGFWIGSSSGSRKANAALAQIAGGEGK